VDADPGIIFRSTHGGKSMSAPPSSQYSPETGFPEIYPALSEEEALLETEKCLYCHDAPCVRACPTHIDIPKFIGRIKTGNVLGAARAILDANILGGTCARVCPVDVLCEGACVENTLLHKPVEISRLQRHAVDHVMEKGIRLFPPGDDTGKRIAVIGAGPSGLSCAFELRRAGHGVVIFDDREIPGGINTYTIAPYKHTVSFCRDEAELVAQMGVEFKMKTRVGRDVSLSDLQRDFDAIFLGLGLGHTHRLSVEGEDLDGAWEALAYLEAVRTSRPEEMPRAKVVVVVGAGNTAIDCATSAARLGAEKVMIVYRRGREDVPAFEYEQEIALADECEFVCRTNPVKILGDGGKVTGVECVRMELGEPGPDGKHRVSPIAGSEHIIACDQVIKALGQAPWELIPGLEGLEKKGGCVQVDLVTFETSIPGVFAGGDCITVGEVVDAVEHGKIAARGIHCKIHDLEATTLGLPGDNGGPRQMWHGVRSPDQIRPPAEHIASIH
jgi:glutamate synthase (NADPH/NADH) small chain